MVFIFLAAACAARSPAARDHAAAFDTGGPRPISAADPWRCIDDPAAALRASRDCGVAPGDSIGIVRTLIPDPRFLRADPYEWTATGPTISQMAGGDDWTFVASVVPDSSAVDGDGAMAGAFDDSVVVPMVYTRRRIATGRAPIVQLEWARRYPSRSPWSAAVRALGTQALSTGTLLECATGRNAFGDDVWSLHVGRDDDLIVVSALIRPEGHGAPASFVLSTMRASRQRWTPRGGDAPWNWHTSAGDCGTALDRLLAATPDP